MAVKTNKNLKKTSKNTRSKPKIPRKKRVALEQKILPQAPNWRDRFIQNTLPLFKTCAILILAALALFTFEIPNYYATLKNPLFNDSVTDSLAANTHENWKKFKESENHFWKKVIKNSDIQTCDENCQDSETANQTETIENTPENQDNSNIETNTLDILNTENNTEQAAGPIAEIQEPVVQEKLKKPLKILIVGDSLMQEKLGIYLESQLKKTNFSVFRFAKYSTGLTNRSYFDWAGTVTRLINEQKPDIVISIFGSNDGQKIQSGKRLINYGAPGWNEAYANNVNSFITKASGGVKKLYYIGLPISSKPDFTEKFIRFNKIYKQETSKFQNVVFVDTWDRFAPNGNFSPTLKDSTGKQGRVKFEDGVHFTEFGSRIVYEILSDYMSKDIEI